MNKLGNWLYSLSDKSYRVFGVFGFVMGIVILISCFSIHSVSLIITFIGMGIWLLATAVYAFRYNRYPTLKEFKENHNRVSRIIMLFSFLGIFIWLIVSMTNFISLFVTHAS